MDDLFRYVEWRALDESTPSPNVITISGESPLITTLENAINAGASPEEYAKIAADFAASPEYAVNDSALNFASNYGPAAEAASAWSPEDSKSLQKRLAEAFGTANLSDLVGKPQFQRDRSRVHDSMVVAKVLGADRRHDASALVRIARTIRLTERVAQSDPLLNSSEAVEGALSALVVIPRSVLAMNRPSEQPEPNPGPGDGNRSELATLDKRIRNLNDAYRFFSSLAPEAITVIREDHERPAREGGSERTASHRAHTFRRRLVLREEIAQELPGEVRAGLGALRLDPANVPILEIIDRLKGELTTVQRRVYEISPLEFDPVFQLGQYFFAFTGRGSGFVVSPRMPRGEPRRSSAMTTMALKVKVPDYQLQPIGIGDLQVVKQQILRYEPGEISYIENILEGESYGREVERRELSEEFTLTEREKIREDERDLQATDRFELKTESVNTSNNTTTTTAGNTVTQNYGGLVESRGSTFARDVVNRAVSKLTDRVREQRSVRLQRELIEKTSHTFENKATGHHVSGIYQWVDKIYQSQVFNFGKRLMYEGIIPEPAAFVIEMNRRSGRPEGLRLERPTEIKFGPKDLQAWNYLAFAKLYDVVGAVEPPPDEFVVVTKNLDVKWDSDHYNYKSDSIPIPPGYTASSIAYYNTDFHGANYGVVAGFNDVFAQTWSLDDETDSLPIYAAGWGTERIMMNLMIACRRQETHLEKWQIRTYETLKKGYRKQYAEYEERLAGLHALTRTQMLLGGGSARNRETERTELKKAFLTLLTDQHFDGFDAIESPPPLEYPQMNRKEAIKQSGFISFFERAFEWENMLYYFYPYIWGRKPRWEEVVMLQDSDSQFEAFLKAGAARVVVPVRPGFEAALAHFVETGEVWLGEDEPDMYSPLFVSILTEIKNRDKAPGEEIPVGDPWEVRMPTSLVLLKDNPKLPEWEKKPSGQWVLKP